MNKIIIGIILFLFFASQALSSDKEEDKRFALKIGSFVYHADDHNRDDYNELFDNQLISLGVKVGKSNEIVLGSFLNSYGDRCALLGLGKSWYNFSDKLSFEGLYAYAGEFFVDQFKHCKNQGIYGNFYKRTGVGFAPYLYHGVKYKVTPIVALELGLIFPKIIVGTVRWQF
jgi:hypothetical protein